VQDHVNSLNIQAHKLLLALLDGPHQIPADVEQGIREWDRQRYGFGWVRWLWFAVPLQHVHRYENYAQVAATALRELRDYCLAGPQGAPSSDGTIKDSRIWLKGKLYRLTTGLRQLLSYLLTHPGASEDDVMRHCAFTCTSHLHKRLKDLRDKLAAELKRSGWRLHIKTDETRVYCEWREAK
jgi:hypothetical protein